jgi:hypothetical protein
VGVLDKPNSLIVIVCVGHYPIRRQSEKIELFPLTGFIFGSIFRT